jgi:hypothetical protein
LEIGQSKDWILRNFADPDDWDGSPLDYQAKIWLYGNIELHFSGELLKFVFSDYIQSLDGGPSLMLRKWIFEKPELLTLSFVIERLLTDEIDFQILHHQLRSLRQITLQLPQSGVKWLFDPVKEGDAAGDFMLGAWVWGSV